MPSSTDLLQTNALQAIHRLLDANLDRAREGLRVVEDWCRFGLDRLDLVERLKQFVSQARALKAEHNLASRRDVTLLVIASDADWAVIAGNLAKLTRMAGAAKLERRDKVDAAPAAVTPLGTEIGRAHV